MEPLPIDEVLSEIIGHLALSNDHSRNAAGRCLVLKAEPGAGKTTRVAPAILDAGLANLADGKGQIVLLQPRRVAARAAAERMSEERGSKLGGDIGYRVRLEGASSSKTRILVCTVGVFLRRLQEDPSIADTAVVIFDEFHERSIDSDLALALTRQVQQEIRPDLAIVVMSATLDSGPIAAYLGDCPAVECPGRTFPINIQYLSHHSSEATDKLAADGVSRMLPKSDGDMLVFLPGLAEIRRTQTLLENLSETENLAVMPLYGDMPLAEQQAVLRPCRGRKIVLATNVAETSLTISGVKTVIDSGLARVNRLDPDLGINRLDLSRISKASAAQRAGRAGRTAPGDCLRLWTEKEQQMLPDFELPEIERVELSECVLQLLAWGERDVATFGWFEKPPATALETAMELLRRLGAVSLESGRLTELGQAMARLPLQPRLARLLIEGSLLGQGKRAAICAALLSERAPFRLRENNEIPSHHTDSDIAEQVRALEKFAAGGGSNSIMGDIQPGAARQILKTADQLYRLLEDCQYIKAKTDPGKDGRPPAQAGASPENKGDQPLLRAVMAAFPDRICKRRSPASAQGTGSGGGKISQDVRALMVGGRGVKLSEQSTVRDSPLFVAVDLVDLKKAELSVRRASAIEAGWLPGQLLSESTDVVYDAARQKVVALRRTRFLDLVLEEGIASMPPQVDPGAILAEAVRTNFDLTALVDESAADYLARVNCLREWLPELNFPDFGPEPWLALLPTWCCGCTSLAELKAVTPIAAVQAALTAEQIAAVDREAPEAITIAGGRRIKLKYEQGKPPVLAARIQELFGMMETPRVARSRQPVMMHLLAPNYRVQQITGDLQSFWKNTYPEVRKELKGRYPKHAWPEDPHQAKN